MEIINHDESVAMISGRKTYYSISEVCTQTDLEAHVLRYWETEFAQLRPKKNRAGNRAYRDKDIEIIRYIKHLLYEEQFTIPGAKKKLSEVRATEVEQAVFENAPTTAPAGADGNIADVKKQLNEIYALLTR